MFSRKIITSTGFYRCCAPSASAPVMVINESPTGECFGGPRFAFEPSPEDPASSPPSWGWGLKNHYKTGEAFLLTIFQERKSSPKSKFWGRISGGRPRGYPGRTSGGKNFGQALEILGKISIAVRTSMTRRRGRP